MWRKIEGLIRDLPFILMKIKWAIIDFIEGR
jgi:hypothetical protein